jgi:hypothetical protein
VLSDIFTDPQSDLRLLGTLGGGARAVVAGHGFGGLAEQEHQVAGVAAGSFPLVCEVAPPPVRMSTPDTSSHAATTQHQLDPVA